MESLDWSRKFDIFSISRLYLRHQLGFTIEQVQQLTTEDMFYIADIMRDALLHTPVDNFDAEVRFVTPTVLAEKLSGGQHG